MEKERNEVIIRKKTVTGVSKKDIESFLGLIILMGINELPIMKLYWSKDMAFHNIFISSIMSRDCFLQIFYNLHLADSS
jgi:hypothetical protein